MSAPAYSYPSAPKVQAALSSVCPAGGVGIALPQGQMLYVCNPSTKSAAVVAPVSVTAVAPAATITSTSTSKAVPPKQYTDAQPYAQWAVPQSPAVPFQGQCSAVSAQPAVVLPTIVQPIRPPTVVVAPGVVTTQVAPAAPVQAPASATTTVVAPSGTSSTKPAPVPLSTDATPPQLIHRHGGEDWFYPYNPYYRYYGYRRRSFDYDYGRDYGRDDRYWS